MKNLLAIIAITAISAFSTSNAHDGAVHKTLSTKVFGNCGMCKKTIEGALKKAEGVESATWNKESKMLEVHYDAAKISVDEIKKTVTDVGYDFEDKKASDEVYNNLPGCCQYREDAE